MVCRLGYEVDATTVSLAFGIHEAQPSQKEVFAFLPVRRYGLNFIVQVCLVRGLPVNLSLVACCMMPCCSHAHTRVMTNVTELISSVWQAVSMMLWTAGHTQTSCRGIGAPPLSPQPSTTRGPCNSLIAPGLDPGQEPLCNQS